MQEQLGVTCIGVQFWTMIAGDLSHFLLQVNSSINFFIYGCISSQFKKALKQKFFRCNNLRNNYLNEQRYNSQRNGIKTTIPLTDFTVDS